jgi:hypothetical protein
MVRMGMRTGRSQGGKGYFFGKGTHRRRQREHWKGLGVGPSTLKHLVWDLRDLDWDCMRWMALGLQAGSFDSGCDWMMDLDRQRGRQRIDVDLETQGMHSAGHY